MELWVLAMLAMTKMMVIFGFGRVGILGIGEIVGFGNDGIEGNDTILG